jgi:RNA ligase
MEISMRYQFPEIRHIDDVLPIVEGREEFIVAQRDWGSVINYVVSMTDTFPPVNGREEAILRECRGLLFYPDGRIMARRLHKFFNVNERDETQAHEIDLGQPHVILEKLDGSMITPVMTESGMRWGTKMGLTDVGMGAEEFVARHPQYEQFARMVMDNFGWTPIFEWCSRKQRIVVDYPVDRLVLIAVRDTVTGEYRSHRWLQEYGEMFEIEVVKAYPGTTESMEHLITETRGSEGIEGWIIRFDDGHMVKVKGDWYVRIHKTKDALVHEKNVLDLIVSEKSDDVKEFMIDDDRRRLEDYETNFWMGVHRTITAYDRYWEAVQEEGVDRKTWAVEWMPKVKEDDPFASSIVFGKFDGKDTRKMVLDIITKNLGSQTRVDEVRRLWGGSRWAYSVELDG